MALKSSPTFPPTHSSHVSNCYYCHYILIFIFQIQWPNVSSNKTTSSFSSIYYVNCLIITVHVIFNHTMHTYLSILRRPFKTRKYLSIFIEIHRLCIALFLDIYSNNSIRNKQNKKYDTSYFIIFVLKLIIMNLLMYEAKNLMSRILYCILLLGTVLDTHL